MALRNQKGETLVETVVSMAIITMLLACAFVILLYSSRATRYSLDIISSINQEATSIFNETYDDSEAVELDTTITVSFGITDKNGNTIASAPSGGYVIEDDMPTIVTENGLIVLGWD